MTSDTPDYDPRFDRAQTIDGAKARYVSDDLSGYGLEDMESDVLRILTDGENPDKRDRPVIHGQKAVGDGGMRYKIQ